MGNAKALAANKEIMISFDILKSGFKINICGNDNFAVKYGQHIFSSLGPRAREILSENFIYSRTAPLGLACAKSLSYQMPEPILREITDYGIKNDLPRIAFANKIKINSLLKKFSQRQINFSKQDPVGRLVPIQKLSRHKAILAMSFGKDSLLSYGLAKEIGLDCQLAYVNEMEDYYHIENVHKRKIIRDFGREQQEQIEYLEDNLDSIFQENLKVRLKEFDNSNGMLAFSLELLPLAFYHRAKYLILGNEKNFDDYWRYQGHKAFPSFDQSSFYARKLNQALSKLTAGNYQTISLVAPLYNLAEIKILFNRYPFLLKYVMSCDLEMTAADRWCHNCPMCANAYLYAAAVGGDPAKIGIKQKLFELKYLRLYPLWDRHQLRAYEMPKQVREEQLLAFLLAYRQGWRGSAIDLFKKKYLAEAKRREKQLRLKFFKIYPMPDAPKEYRAKLFNIYQGELKQLL
jgi:hypothetical protein